MSESCLVNSAKTSGDLIPNNKLINLFTSPSNCKVGNCFSHWARSTCTATTSVVECPNGASSTERFLSKSNEAIKWNGMK